LLRDSKLREQDGLYESDGSIAAEPEREHPGAHQPGVYDDSAWGDDRAY
jgi:hypothetical protein